MNRKRNTSPHSINNKTPAQAFTPPADEKIKGLKEMTHGYKKERNKANDFTCKLQYDVFIFSNRRQSDFTKCSLMISQRVNHDQSTGIAGKFIFREYSE